MLNSIEVAAWGKPVIEKILSDKYGELILLIINEAKDEKVSLKNKFKFYFKSFLCLLYVKIDRLVAKTHQMHLNKQTLKIF